MVLWSLHISYITSHCFNTPRHQYWSKESALIHITHTLHPTKPTNTNTVRFLSGSHQRAKDCKNTLITTVRSLHPSETTRSSRITVRLGLFWVIRCWSVCILKDDNVKNTSANANGMLMSVQLPISLQTYENKPMFNAHVNVFWCFRLK